MASTNFTYSPTTGTGNATVTARTSSTANTSQSDKVATITISNPYNYSATVRVTQKYRPWFLQDYKTFPAIGGNLYFTVHTEYNIKFEAIPSWITLKLGNQTITTSTTIDAADADGRMFTMTAPPNTATTSRSVTNTFCMRHYIGASLQSYKDYLEVNQDGVVENYLVITSSTIPCEGGTIRGYVQENEDFPWFAKDGIDAYTGTPWVTQPVTSLTKEDVWSPTSGPGSARTNFTVTIPRNPTTSALTWVIGIEAGFAEKSISAATTQSACPPEPPASSSEFTLSSDHVPATGGTITATTYTGEDAPFVFGDQLNGNYYDDGTDAGTILLENVLTPWEDPTPSGNLDYPVPWTITVPANNTGRDIVWWFRIIRYDTDPASRRCYFIQYAS